MMSIKDITIVITSFKSENKIKECLNSIDKHCQIINVENSNNQDYKRQIENEFKNVKCILTGENLGYGKANNIGLKEVKTKYALILNPDTKLYPETLNSFISLANDIKDFAIIGPGIVEGDDLHKITIKQEAKETDTVKGYAMLMNLSQFEDIGFFDENIFFFLEEIDLCRRLIKKNKEIYFSDLIKVYHEGGHSHDSSFDHEMELSRNWHWMWSTFYFNRKHNGFLISLLVVFPKLFSSFFKFLLFLILGNNKKKEIYYHRFSGLINSIMGKTSWYRPKV
jgi:N-acetylglucosaminyl-diphospho-decaprenol L-rhamnosyltransferase